MLWHNVILKPFDTELSLVNLDRQGTDFFLEYFDLLLHLLVLFTFAPMCICLSFFGRSTLKFSG